MFRLFKRRDNATKRQMEKIIGACEEHEKAFTNFEQMPVLALTEARLDDGVRIGECVRLIAMRMMELYERDSPLSPDVREVAERAFLRFKEVMEAAEHRPPPSKKYTAAFDSYWRLCLVRNPKQFFEEWDKMSRSVCPEDIAPLIKKVETVFCTKIAELVDDPEGFLGKINASLHPRGRGRVPTSVGCSETDPKLDDLVIIEN